MAFATRITLQDDTPADQHYDEIVKNSTSTIRSDVARPLSSPMALTIAHELSKDKKRQNSAIMLDRTELGADSVTLGNARLMVKLSFDNEILTLAQLDEMRAQVVEFLSATNFAKFVGREH